MSNYNPDSKRYENMTFNRCGKSGLKLPAISLGLWQNFSGNDNFENSRKMIRKAFDLGITHIDLANNYGPPPGSAEETFGNVMEKDFRSLRDEMIITTKAGYGMWAGPYGDFGSRKYLMSSLDQSLKRMKLDYVDIFYHHRPDADTPIEETMTALHDIVKQGKALYVGISNYYEGKQLKEALDVLNSLGTPCLIHQVAYSMFNRKVENEALDVAQANGTGSIAFSPLAQGLLTDKYLNGIPEDSRIGKGSQFLNKGSITEENIAKVKKLNSIASERGQSLAQMALSWVLRQENVCSVLIGASRSEQIEENVKILENLEFSDAELSAIELILNG